MKHQVKALLEDTRAVLQRLDDEAKAAEEAWQENTAPKFRALRDMLTERLRRGKPITADDVREAFGDTDLDSYSGPRVYRDIRASQKYQRRYAVARIITSRPNVKTEVYYDDLVNFATLLMRLREEDADRVIPNRTQRFFVTDQELNDLGFNRFPAVIGRVKDSATLSSDYAIEVRA